MRYCIVGETRQLGQNSSGGIMVPSGWNLVRLHAVRMLPSGPANETACGQEYASLRAGVEATL
jgi:hypothetical protein